jgi:hypothetical protein
MKRLYLLATLALALCGSIPRADAASVVLCPSSRSQAGSAAGQISIVNLSQTYSADSAGCVVASGFADIAIFHSAGYTEPGKHRTILFSTGIAAGTTDFVVGILPAKAYIEEIIFSNSVAAAVTGGISVGTTANGTNIVAAQAVGASTDVGVPGSALLLPVPVTTSLAAPIHIAAVTGWNGANVTVTITYGYY